MSRLFRMAWASTAVWCLMSTSPLAQGRGPASSEPLPALLTAAASYLKSYEERFSAVVAQEQYSQSVRTPQSTLGNRSSPRERELRSDIMVMNLGASGWVEFRDVYEVDRKAVRDHDTRLQRLFLEPTSGALARAQQIADESARYNLGVPRNINVPTMALTYLSAANQPRSAFQLDGTAVVRGARLVVVAFHEVASPTLIRANGIDVPTSGRFWIEAVTGEVRRTEVTCAPLMPRRVTGTTAVDYDATPALKFLVPITMDESYRLDTGELDTGHATYSDFRAFTVDVHAVGRGGGSGPRD